MEKDNLTASAADGTAARSLPQLNKKQRQHTKSIIQTLVQQVLGGVLNTSNPRPDQLSAVFSEFVRTTTLAVEESAVAQITQHATNKLKLKTFQLDTPPSKLSTLSRVKIRSDAWEPPTASDAAAVSTTVNEIQSQIRLGIARNGDPKRLLSNLELHQARVINAAIVAQLKASQHLRQTFELNEAKQCADCLKLCKDLNTQYSRLHSTPSQVVKADTDTAAFISLERTLNQDICTKQKPVQKPYPLLKLMVFAAAGKLEFDAAMVRLEQHLNRNSTLPATLWEPRPLKKLSHVVEALALDPRLPVQSVAQVDRLDTSNAFDIIRGRFICSTMAAACRLLIALQTATTQNRPEFALVYSDNRFTRYAMPWVVACAIVTVHRKY